MNQSTPSAIDVRQVAKRFGKRGRVVEALRGVDISVKRGEIYGLLGRNGAGKTTLVKVILGIVRPTSGSTSLLGRSSRSPASRRPVGYLPEDHRLPEYRTGADTLGFYARLSNVPASTRRARLPGLLKLVGLADAARRKVRSYSKGMKQRLGLAQALFHDPEVLFLDEPTDGVDPVGRSEIRDLLLKLKGEGKTIFLNSHLLSEVEQVCDRVGIIENGRLIREGSIEELTRTRLTYRMVTVPALDAATGEELARHAVSLDRGPEGFEVGLERPEDLDRAVDLLRARGFSIRALAETRLTLEEVFLKAVEGGVPPAAPETRRPAP
jgi:ABC-2 type transport system ATP-binding protein